MNYPYQFENSGYYITEIENQFFVVVFESATINSVARKPKERHGPFESKEKAIDFIKSKV